MIMFFYNVNLKNTSNEGLMLRNHGNDICIDIYRLISIILIQPSSDGSSEKFYLVLKEQKYFEDIHHRKYALSNISSKKMFYWC